MDTKRFCPECQAGGVQSVVTAHGETTTLMGFLPCWDKEGNEHRHNGNKITGTFSCSKGHRWEEDMPKPHCPTCGPEENWTRPRDLYGEGDLVGSTVVDTGEIVLVAPASIPKNAIF